LFCEYSFHIFSHVTFKGVINKQAATSPQATMLPMTNFKFFFAFLRILSSIGPNLAARIPQAQKHFSRFLPKQKDAGSFVFKPVTPIEIEAEILSIPLNKGYGLYSCPTRILKCASKIISCPLCKLINNSWKLGPIRRN